MDPRWLPWCWAVGAAACAVLFWAVQPWRAEWAGGFRLVMKYPAAWWLPALFLGCDAAVEGIWGGGPGVAEGKDPVAMTAWSAVASAVAQSLHGLHFGRGTALLGAMLLVVNAWGIRRGFLKGVSSVTGWRGYAVLAGLGVGAVALIADLALAGRGLPQVWHAVVAALAMPLVGWMSAAVLAGLLLLAETERRDPEKVGGVRWLESAAAHSVRLWPWALGHGLLWWMGRALPVPTPAYVRELPGLVALLLAFAPLIFLHVRELPAARPAAREATGFWKTAGWQPPAWLAGAGLLFYLSFLAGQGLADVAAGQSAPLRIGLASLHGIAHIGVMVVSLVAWAEFCLAGATAIKRRRRPRS